MLFPKVTTYPVDGIVIATDRPTICNQYLCSIRLTELQRRTSGEYRCEISGDAPEFKLANGTRNMTVEVLPQDDPTISGLSASYLPNEHIAANCTSDRSSLVTRLLWFINGRTVSFGQSLIPSSKVVCRVNGTNLCYELLQLHTSHC